MNLFNQICSLSVRELEDLQSLVLTEIQRRKVIVGDFTGKAAARPTPADTDPVDSPATIPVQKRSQRPLSPRRRAA
jgi:hypothetical protein